MLQPHPPTEDQVWTTQHPAEMREHLRKGPRVCLNLTPMTPQMKTMRSEQNCL